MISHILLFMVYDYICCIAGKNKGQAVDSVIIVRAAERNDQTSAIRATGLVHCTTTAAAAAATAAAAAATTSISHSATARSLHQRSTAGICFTIMSLLFKFGYFCMSSAGICSILQQGMHFSVLLSCLYYLSLDISV